MKRKKIGWLLACTGLLLCGCSRLASEGETETELKEGQRKAEIQVVSITGNELTYYEVQEETEAGSEAETGLESEMVPESGMGSKSETETGNASETEMETEAEEKAKAEGNQSESSSSKRMGSGEMPDMSQMGSGEMPDMSRMGGRRPGMGGRGSSTGSEEDSAQLVSSEDASEDTEESGEMPDMSQMGGEMPDMSQMGGEMPDMSRMGGEMPDLSQISEMFGTAMETETVYLPVGITVHTDNGKKATFSILEAGDELTVLFETKEDGTEMITEIWLEGSSS